MNTLTARMPNPAMIIPEAMKPIQDLFGSISAGGVPSGTGPRRDLGRRGPPLRRAGLAALILMIATTNLFNRLNVSTRQPAGAWG